MLPRETNGDVWVFGYGSLVWRPAFEHCERRVGRVRGWSRRFWQGSTDHRGIPGAPGRVVTLVPDAGAALVGVAYRVVSSHVGHVLPQLDHREQGGYDRVELEVTTDPGSIRAVTYVATKDNPNWLGEAPLEHIARQIRSSHGPSGANIEYLLELARALETMGSHDPHVHALARLLDSAKDADLDSG